MFVLMLMLGEGESDVGVNDDVSEDGLLMCLYDMGIWGTYSLFGSFAFSKTSASALGKMFVVFLSVVMCER